MQAAARGVPKRKHVGYRIYLPRLRDNSLCVAAPSFFFTPSTKTGRPYVYQPLESQDQFRLVKLLPGTEDEPLHVELHTYHLDKAPSFDVLSYLMVLRLHEPKSGVLCGEHEFLVNHCLLDSRFLP